MTLFGTNTVPVGVSLNKKALVKIPLLFLLRIRAVNVMMLPTATNEVLAESLTIIFLSG
ncbi:hypothetical protein P615_03110 [Brevibacillus laterosporus PE36]|nr:hypothetical protein P615_03110 [Brevibacillus laterosporus PE36]